MDYRKPGIVPIRFNFDGPDWDERQYITLSGKDVLGIVQAAFEELGPQSPELIAIKREVLKEVSEGKLAHALRAAIVGAGKSGRG